MNRHLLFSFLLILTGVAGLCAQGLRTSVCVVYPECALEDSIVLVDFAKAMSSIGFTSDATSLRAYAGKSFGSGVLIDDKVLTNRHVVGYAKMVKLVFMLHDQTLTYEHCPVISTSPTADVAAIQLPANVAELHALSLGTDPAQDGEDIFAAGFPGLNHEPSWQLTRGSVSNSILKVDGSDYIQHTAAIDPGSSGGPLLRKRDGKFEVVGLNTMKAFQRDRVGMAVNANDIMVFLSAEANKIDQQTLDALRDVDAAHLQEYYRMLPDSMKTVLHDMDNHLPMDRILAIANYFGGVEQLQKKNDNKGVIDVKKADKRLQQNKPGISELRDNWCLYVDYNAFPKIGGSLTDGRWLQIPSLNLEQNFTYFLYGGGISIPMLPAMTQKYISGGDTIPAQPYTSIGFGVFVKVGFQLPIHVNASNVIVPKITAEEQLGVQITEKEFLTLIMVRAGVDYRYQFKKMSLVFGLHYLLMPFSFSTDQDLPLSHGFSARLGFAF